MALLNSGFVIDDPSEISGIMQELLRAELGIDRKAAFEEIEIDFESADDEDETIEEEIPDEDDQENDVGHKVESDDEDIKEDL
jgi:hypothetical protein